MPSAEAAAVAAARTESAAGRPVAINSETAAPDAAPSAAGSVHRNITVSVGPGTVGASTRREYERRSAKREKRIREKHTKLGGLIPALTDEPQSTAAWRAGAAGEERLGGILDSLANRAPCAIGGFLAAGRTSTTLRSVPRACSSSTRSATRAAHRCEWREASCGGASRH